MLSVKGLFGIHDPFPAADSSQEAAKGGSVSQFFESGEKLQLSGIKRLFQGFHKQPAEEAGEDAHRKKESFATRDPAASVGRESAAGNDTMQVRVEHQILSPGVQDSEEADLGTQMFGISSNSAQGFSGSPEENVVHHFLILESDVGNLFREGKDHVEVLSIEELGLTVLDPLGAGWGRAFWTMPVPAAVI